MGTTKQAASKLVEAMVVSGYVERETGAPDGRQRPVHLTLRGKDLLRAVEQIYAELEQEWAQMIGARDLQRMRRDLVRVLSDADDGALPPVRPVW
jgi:DNA-binding MarR family transcriptional regulator